MSGSTTTLDLKVTADARAAVQGLKPLSRSLDELTQDAQQTETALKDLDKSHTVKLNDEAIENARKEISRLRGQMREDLRLDINANTAAAQRRIRQLQSSIKTLDAESIEIEASVDVDVDSAVSGLGALQARLANLDTTTLELAPGLGGLAGNLGRVGSVAGKAAGPLAVAGAAFGGWKLGEAAADVETMVVQLDALTKGHGAETMADIQKWAALTPFAIEDAAGATKKLVAAGVDLQDIPDYLNDIGNVAAATGVPIDQLGTVFAQMESKGKATFEELQQIAEAGVPVWKTLAEALGLTTAEVQKLATEGKLGADAIDLARESLAQLYPTAMQDQAETFNGQMSTLKDTASQLGSTLGTAVLPMMISLLDTMNDVAGGALWLGDKVTDLTDVWWDFRESLAASSDDLKTTKEDLADLGTSPIWEQFSKIKEIATTPPEWWPGADDDIAKVETVTLDAADAQEAVGTQAQQAAAKVKASMAGQKEDIKSAEEVARDYQRALEDAFAAVAGIGGNVRSRVSFIIEQDDLRESINNAIKGSKDEKGIKLPATIEITDVAGLKDAQQGLISDISTMWVNAVDEGIRREKIDPNFDLAGWWASQRAGIGKLLINAGVDEDSIESVLSSVIGAPRKIPASVTADITAAQANINSLAPPPPMTVDVLPGWVPVPESQLPVPPASVTAPVITPTVDAAPATTALANIATPRQAVITPTLRGVPEAVRALDNIAVDRYATIHVRAVQANPGGADSDAGTPFPQSIVPQLFGDAATVAGLRSASLAAPAMVATSVPGTTGKQQLPNGGTVTQLAPRAVPIKVYLDGAEIADHLTLKADRLATATSVRRRA